MKICSTCKNKKSYSEFYKNSGNKDGLTSLCKLCVKQSNNKSRNKNKEKYRVSQRTWDKNNPEKIRGYKLKHKYKISIEDYELLLIKQEGVCAICKQPENKAIHGFLAVDHCHQTEKIRGLLCFDCNTGLGKLEPYLESVLYYINNQ